MNGREESGPPASIRMVRATDAADLQRNCFTAMTVADVRHHVVDLNDPDGPEGHPDRLGIVAETWRGEVVATCTLSRLEHRMCRHRADIGGFVIARPHQGTGLARRMLGSLEELARTRWDCTILEIGCRGGTHAEDAYRGLGFTEWARLPGGWDDRGTVYDEVRLFKRVPTPG